MLPLFYVLLICLALKLGLLFCLCLTDLLTTSPNPTLEFSPSSPASVARGDGSKATVSPREKNNNSEQADQVEKMFKSLCVAEEETKTNHRLHHHHHLVLHLGGEEEEEASSGIAIMAKKDESSAEKRKEGNIRATQICIAV